MNTEHGSGKALLYLARAALLRCPVCGVSPIFHRLRHTRSLNDWFTPLDGCPRCGYPYEREPGYFLASVWIINYGLGSLLGIFIYVILEVFVHPPFRTMLAAVIGPVFCFNLLFARHAKALFIAIDHYYDPHEKEPGDDDGNVPRLETPRGGPAHPAKPLPPTRKDRPCPENVLP
jgi:uncharacterized protein (DUF983 family)